jgi:predicted metal-dependent phosphoesterase TrpH
MYKLDLHTHSTQSPDGGISTAQYRHILETGLLDCVAITDHNSVSLARQLHDELGDKIIVGEEIMTTEGEIVGLFLSEVVQPHQTPLKTIQDIKSQGGLVYIPHPFETVRKGLHPQIMEELAEYIDIVEICNGRAFAQNRSDQAVVWARMNRVLGAASSDAHGIRGIGKTYTQVGELPTRESLIEVLKSGIPMTARPSMRSLLYPKYHRARKKIRGNR